MMGAFVPSGSLLLTECDCRGGEHHPTHAGTGRSLDDVDGPVDIHLPKMGWVPGTELVDTGDVEDLLASVDESGH